MKQQLPILVTSALYDAIEDFAQLRFYLIDGSSLGGHGGLQVPCLYFILCGVMGPECSKDNSE